MAEHNFKDQYEYWDQEADKLLGVANGMNYQDFQNGSEYQDLNTRYTDRGNKAMENTLAQVAARTGGLASSYATMAANNSYNDYMSQLEDAARNLYSQRLNESQQAYQLARNNADDYYSRWMQEQQLAAANAPRYYGGSSGGSRSSETPANAGDNLSLDNNPAAHLAIYSTAAKDAFNQKKSMTDVLNYIYSLPITTKQKNDMYDEVAEWAKNVMEHTPKSDNSNYAKDASYYKNLSTRKEY